MSRLSRAALAGALITLSHMAHAETKVVTDYVKAIWYPARVVGVNFDNPLSASRQIKYGAWTLRFGSQAPVATWRGPPIGGVPGLSIGGLICMNAVSGDTPCELNILAFNVAPPRADSCQLAFVGGSVAPFMINCPKSIELEQ